MMESKIAFFTFESSVVPGVSKSLINIIDHLSIDYKPIVILHKSGDIETELLKRNITYYIVKSYTYTKKINENKFLSICKYIYKRIYNFFQFNKVKKIMNIEEIKIIHLNKITCSFGAEVSIKCKIPFITHIREFLEEDQSREFINKKYCYNLVKHSYKILAISNSIKNKYERILNTPIEVIYNGVDVNNYIIHNHELFKKNKIKMLIVGRITSEKGQLDALKIVKKILELNFPVSLCIVGEVQDISYYNSLLYFIDKHALNDSVNILHHTNNIKEIYNTNDICIVCSKKEAFGRIVIEAMLAGMVIVAHNQGAMKELININENGYLYNNIDEATEIIKYIYQNNSIHKHMAKVNVNYAAQNFSIENTVNKIENVYSQLLGEI